nr:serine/threonine-protein kinase 40-like [Dasypus novemcinctus]
MQRAGTFILGPCLGASPVPSTVQCLARAVGTGDFHQLKILTPEERGDQGMASQEEGPDAAMPESSPLALLHTQDGGVHHHGPFQARTCEDTESRQTDKEIKERLCLVLHCLCVRDASDKAADLIHRQHYLVKEERLSRRESEALHGRAVVPETRSLGACSEELETKPGPPVWEGGI